MARMLSEARKPTDKVAAGGAVGSAALVVVFIGEAFDVTIDPLVAAAFVSLATWLAAYWKTERRPK